MHSETTAYRPPVRASSCSAFLGAGQHDGRGGVVDTGGVAGGHAAPFGEDGLQSGQVGEGDAVADVLVGGERAGPLPAWHRHDLVAEAAVGGSLRGPGVALHGEGVLVGSRDPQARARFSAVTPMWMLSNGSV